MSATEILTLTVSIVCPVCSYTYTKTEEEIEKPTEEK